MADSNITKTALANALKRLMTDRDFEKISVSEICEECGMNRKSFYYHFKDKYDLINWIFYVNFLGNLQVASYNNGWDALYDLCEVFYTERDFYVKALQIEGQNSFHDYVLETIRPLVVYFTADIFKGESEQQFFYTFFADAFLYSIMRWLRDEMQIKPRDYVQNMQNVLKSLATTTVEVGDTEEQSVPES